MGQDVALESESQLRVDGISISFGGVQAIYNVSSKSTKGRSSP